MINSISLVESLLLTVMICSEIYVTITDIKRGIIENKILLIAGSIGLVANIVYYTIYAHTFIAAFLLNVITMSVISVAFYLLHIWAAGDSKLLILVIFLIPARIYYEGNNIVATVIIMIIIFSMAYLYILLESLYIGIKEKNFFKINLLKTDIILLIKQYIKCTCIVTILDFLLRLVLPKIYLSNPELIAMINMIAVMTSYHIKFLDKVFTICLLIAATVVCFLISGGISFNNRIEVYAIVFIVLLFRLCAEKYNYKVIPTAKVEKGMVIAYPTVLYFISSKINGLPKKTTEDMRSRITEDEARSIQRWENSKYGQPTIVIVRKIPFAIFISIGSIIYVIIRILSEI